MGTTPIYDLPYPELTGTAPNGPAAFKALAESTETAIDGISQRFAVCGLYKQAAQTISSRTPTTAWTQITWPSTYVNTSLGDLTVTSNEIVNTSGKNLYVAVTASLGWTNNTSGARWMSIRKTNGASVDYYASDTIQPETNGIAVTRTALLVLEVESGASLGVVGAQNSGGNLDVVASLTSSGGPVNFFQVEIKGVA